MESKTCQPMRQYKLGPWRLMSPMFGMGMRMVHLEDPDRPQMRDEAALYYRDYLRAVGWPIETMRRLEPPEGTHWSMMGWTGVWEEIEKENT